MPTKSNGGAATSKKSDIKVRDMKPAKDAKGGKGGHGSHSSHASNSGARATKGDHGATTDDGNWRVGKNIL